MILEIDWLQEHNPTIDWRCKHLILDRCLDACHPQNKERVFLVYLSEQINQVRIHEVAHIPEYLAGYEKVFSEEEFRRLPKQRSWDHVIELIPGFSNTQFAHLSESLGRFTILRLVIPPGRIYACVQ